MRTRAVGIDPSWRATGLVVLDLQTDGKLQHDARRIDFGPVPHDPRSADRANEKAQALLCPLLLVKPRLRVCLEDFAPGSKFGREDAGLLRFALLGAMPTDQLVKTVAVPRLKLYAAGKGNASKIEVIRAVERKWGFVTDDDNLADAYVLAHIALALDHTELATLGYEQDVLGSLLA